MGTNTSYQSFEHDKEGNLKHKIPPEPEPVQTKTN